MDLTTAIIIIAIFLLLVILKVPIAYSMIISGFVGVVYLRSWSAAFDIAGKAFFSNFTSYTMTAVPMFVLMGFIAYYSGLGEKLFNACYKFFGHISGGLLLAVQAACALFGAICGSLPAAVATMGTIVYPEMKKLNCNVPFSLASIAAGSSLGSLIPPSVLLIIYGIATETSIGKLFIAGILPGLTHMSMYMLGIFIITRINPTLVPVGPKVSWSERFQALREGVPETIFVFCLSLGGLFLGWFTPTEAGAVGAISLFLVTLLTKKMNLQKLKNALFDTIRLSAMVYLMIVGATIFGRFIAFSKLTIGLGSFVESLDFHPFIILLVIILIYLFLGTFIEGIGMVLITIPVFYPIIVSLGYDPIWYGIIIVMAMSMAVMTPPIGSNVYILKTIAPEVPLVEIFKWVLPFVLVDLLTTAIFIVFPQIVLVLPNLIY